MTISLVASFLKIFKVYFSHSGCCLGIFINYACVAQGQLISIKIFVSPAEAIKNESIKTLLRLLLSV